MSLHIDVAPTCDMCGNPVGSTSTDIWNLTTLYLESGEVHKTGEQGDEDFDYLVVCTRVRCQTALKVLWDKFVTDVQGAGT